MVEQVAERTKKQPDSTHVIQLDRPAAVVDAIRRVVTAVREQKPLQTTDP